MTWPVKMSSICCPAVQQMTVNLSIVIPNLSNFTTVEDDINSYDECCLLKGDDLACQDE